MRWALIAALLGGCFLPELEVEPTPLDDAVCRACASMGCAETYAACTALPACDELLSCVLRCGADEGCRFGCANTHPDGLNEGLALLECVEDACPEDCAGLF
jgi:hypothetical protein